METSEWAVKIKGEYFLILREEEKQTLLEVIQKISDFFWGPKSEQCEDMLRPSFWLPIEKILPRLDSPSVQVFNKIKTTLNNFSTGQALLQCLEEEYIRLFISDRQGIRAPLYASCYGTEDNGEPALLMGEPALEMIKRFESKGLSLANNIHEPPDHLSIELEYLYFLLERGWGEKDDSLLEEALSFGSETMAPWVMKLQQRLTTIETGNHFYPFIITFLCSILNLVGRLNKTL